ncbi:MAG: transposase [Conexivisphaerales archaeon]
MSLGGGIPPVMPAPASGDVRTVRLRLLPNGSQERKLRRLADVYARLWNEVNYVRRRQFFEKGRVDLETTYREFYYKYRGVLGINAQQLLNMNNEAWTSFFKLLKERKEGRLPPFIRKVSPPGYWKDRLLGKRELMIVVRSDRYYLEPINGGEGYLVLKDFRMRIKYAGKIKWSGKQGRLVIKLEGDRWFAYVPVEVGKEPPKSNRRGKVRGVYDKIQVKTPIGDEKAFVDIGLNNLFAVTTTSGKAVLVKGGAVKSEYYWWKRETAAWQSIRDKLRGWGLPTWRRYHVLYLKAQFKTRERLRHLYRTAVRFLAEHLWRLGVSEVYVGYPYMVSQDNGNEYNTNVWWYRKILGWLRDAFEEYGVKLYVVNEYGTSKRCSICGVVHENGRRYRGLFVCAKTGRQINADINAALNIARKVGHNITVKEKIQSFLVTHNGVRPLIPPQGANAQDPSVKPRP